MVIFYKKWKKHNEINLTKNKMDKQPNNEKSSTLPSVWNINQFTIDKNILLPKLNCMGKNLQMDTNKNEKVSKKLI